GMGRFPIGGEAYYRDDFGEFRSGPPVHGHQGNDIWAAFDAPIRAPADGVVRFEDSGLGGKGAFVTEPDGTYYYLAHLNGFAPELSSGDTVRTGQLIGFNGDSGNARGGPPHVHFEIHPRGGAAVNPKPILDQWLKDALAGVSALVTPYLQGGVSASSGGGGTRPLTAVGMVRHFDGGGGLLTSPSRPAPPAPRSGDQAKAQRASDALVSPLTPAVLREHAPPGL
ncbi:MAG: M23 family metallopeptidase, partial [Actinobacteria bacterium]|nr:M23 family metallopeptidase [Actinomycetota bacterium]